MIQKLSDDLSHFALAICIHGDAMQQCDRGERTEEVSMAGGVSAQVAGDGNESRLDYGASRRGHLRDLSTGNECLPF